MRTGLPVVALALAACGPAPCTHCPPIEGSYTMSITQVSKTGSDLCSGLFVPQFDATVVIRRNGSELTSLASGLSLRGQESDDGQFSLDGSDQSTAAAPTVTLTGRFEAPNTVSGQWFIDSFVYGAQVRGSGYHVDPSDECTATATFTGIRP